MNGIIFTLALLILAGCTAPRITTSDTSPRQQRTRPVYIDSMLQRHNEIRAEVGAPPLAYSDSLAKLAERYAQYLIQDCRPEAQEHSYRQGVTENLYWRMFYITPMDAVESWYREKQFYTGGAITGAGAAKYGHYTAMISRRSTHVGFGVERCTTGSIVVVAYYYPVGNILGESP
ncbi:MAG: hypothetical protein JNL32_01160 [Candidatus Kapabacteria bacterium]|nr:hypothetical protein [Candidatus Kapabacteria bacterium]